MLASAQRRHNYFSANAPGSRRNPNLSLWKNLYFEVFCFFENNFFFIFHVANSKWCLHLETRVNSCVWFREALWQSVLAVMLVTNLSVACDSNPAERVLSEQWAFLGLVIELVYPGEALRLRCFEVVFAFCPSLWVLFLFLYAGLTLSCSRLSPFTTFTSSRFTSFYLCDPKEASFSSNFKILRFQKSTAMNEDSVTGATWLV